MESSSVTAIPSYAEARPYNARGGSDMPASPPTMAADPGQGARDSGHFVSHASPSTPRTEIIIRRPLRRAFDTLLSAVSNFFLFSLSVPSDRLLFKYIAIYIYIYIYIYGMLVPRVFSFSSLRRVSFFFFSSRFNESE